MVIDYVKIAAIRIILWAISAVMGLGVQKEKCIDEEFKKVLETEGSGNIADILEYSGALLIREKEAMEFDESEF